MRTRVGIGWLAFAFLSAPLVMSAQSLESKYVVSIRELRIPPKARQAFDQGAFLLQHTDPAGSLSHFRRAIAEFAGYYEAYYEIGVANLKLQRIAEGEQAFRKSIEVSYGQYARSLFGLAAVLDYKEKFVDAEEAARKGLDLDPNSWSGHYVLGRALFGLNRLHEAEECARAALRRKAESLEALRLLTDIHGRETDYSAVVSDLDEYLKLDPDSPTGAKARAIRYTALRMLAESNSASGFSLP